MWISYPSLHIGGMIPCLKWAVSILGLCWHQWYGIMTRSEVLGGPAQKLNSSERERDSTERRMEAIEQIPFHL